MSGDPIFLKLKIIHCVGCAYSEECVLILWWFDRRVVWPTATRPMSTSCPSTTADTFSLTNLQEEVRIGITTLSRKYAIKCYSSLFIHRSIIEILTTQDQCDKMDSDQNHYFWSLLITNFPTKKNHYKNTNTDVAFKPHVQIDIGTYYSFFFRSQLQHLPNAILISFKIGRQNIFSTPRLNNLDGKFPH